MSIERDNRLKIAVAALAAICLLQTGILIGIYTARFPPPAAPEHILSAIGHGQAPEVSKAPSLSLEAIPEKTTSPFVPAEHADPDVVSGVKMSVHDGDTLSAKVRLTAIDCPELSQPFGDEATDFVKALVSQQRLRLRLFGTDKYGRILADVILPDGRT